jgi:hypothetical protein
MFTIHIYTSTPRELTSVEDFINGRLDEKDFADFDGFELKIKDIKIFNKTQQFLILNRINHTSIITF